MATLTSKEIRLKQLGWHGGRFWDAIDEMAEGTDQDGPIATDGDGTVWKFVFTFCENDFDMDVDHGLLNYKRTAYFLQTLQSYQLRSPGQEPVPIQRPPTLCKVEATPHRL